MKKYKILIPFLLILTSAGLKAQHSPLFSQYIFNGLVINPAYATGYDGLTGILYYKKQWAGFEGAPTTSSATIHSNLKNERFGIGLIYLNDQYGLKNQNDIAGSFAYRIKTGKGQLGMGLSGGVAIVKNNYNKIKTTDPFDQTFDQTSQTRAYPKIGMGLYYHTKKFFTGISIPQWLFTNTSDHGHPLLKRTLFINSGYYFSLSEVLQLTPSVLFKYISGSPLQADINLMTTWKNTLSGGISYRMYNSLIFLIQYQISNFTVGYAYDIATGHLSSYTSGSHEFMLRYRIKYGINLPSPRNF